MNIMRNPLYKLQSKRRLKELLFLEDSSVNLKKMFCSTNYIIRKKRNKNKKGQFKTRKIEEPKKELKRIHSRLKDLLTRVSLPEYLHSGKRKRSYRTNANFHKDNDYVVNLDIAKYYPSCRADIIYDFFKDKLQTSPDIAFYISKICTVNGHLATGSPVSQILSFLACWEMFEEIKIYTDKEMIKFSVYVDDITLSSAEEIKNVQIATIKKIIEKFGFSTKKSKQKRFSKGKAKEITGVVINNGELWVPNKRKKKVIDLAEIEDPTEKELRSLFGRITEIQYVENKKTFEVIKVGAKLLIDKKAS